MELGRSPDFYERRDGAAVGCSARSGVREIWAAAYLWLGAIDLPQDALLFSVELDDYARRVRADAATTLADDGALEAVDGVLLFGVSTANMPT